MAISHERMRTLIAETVRDSGVTRASRSEELTPGTVLAPRFEIERRIGAGGAGVVYRARDQKAGVSVALKMLHLRDPDAIYWLKDEFRALADLVHPNLIQLHELFHEGGHWFFTMELVDGVAWNEHVAPFQRVDYTRLCAALGQLVDGVEAMHGAGKLHRDLKPSNVLVRPDGQVIILDFGLVQDLSLLQDRESEAALRDRMALICGTPEYMAPEQATGVFATAASDWYAVGAMLYESLTGTLPHAGDAIQILLDKQLRDPPPPSTRTPAIPSELDRLCVDLLSRDPKQRPGPDEVRARLGLGSGAQARRRSVRVAPPVLVGRSRELQALDDAYAASREGAVWMSVHGPSGIGKSALLRRFLGALARDPSVLVLSSRCFERESVPYKALDGLVDRLAAYLAERSETELQGLDVPNLHALLQVFPVLSRCQRLAAAAEPGARELDVQETRRRAFAALRELVSRLATRTQLVLFIDDLQWGDAESARVLMELVHAAVKPHMLFLGCYRTEEATSSPLLSVLLPSLASGMAGVAVRELALRPLEATDALGLATLMIGAQDGERAERIVRESAGSPFFIEALVQYHETRGWAAEHGPVSLDELVLARVAELPEPARKLLHVVVVAGQPLAQSVALHAARLEGNARALSQLRTARLVRTRGRSDEPALEPYHDRIREAVSRALDEASTPPLHAALADALEARGQLEPALLAFQHYGARRPERALPYARQAAAAARAALAFSLAADLYALALSCSDGDGETQRAYADALANAGRAAEAAVQYAKLDLPAFAAQQYLAAGHVDEGLLLLQPLMHAAGVRYPETPDEVIAILLESWAEIVKRGTHVAAPQPGELPRATLERIDVARLATDELSHSDPIRAAAIMLQVTQPALDLGEPGRAAWALSRYGLFTASSGAAATIDGAEDMFERAEALAAASCDTLLLGSIYVNRSRLSLSAHRWREGLERAERGARYMAEQCVGGWRYVAVANNVVLYSLCNLGRLRELGERAFAQEQRATELGDIYVHLTTHFYAALCRLAADDPEGASMLLAAAERLRKHTLFLFQDWLLLQGNVLCDLYCREPEQAWRRIERGYVELERAHLQNLAVVREFAHRLYANVAVAMVARAKSPDDAALFRARAEHRVSLLEANGNALGRAAAHGVRAGIAWCDGRPVDVLGALEAARAAYLDADLPLDAAACSSLYSRLVGQPDDHAAWAGFGVVSPDRWLSLHFPWFVPG